MFNVSIIGAGELGGEVAYLLARHDVVETVCLIDDQTSIAMGKALDIRQAGAVERFTTSISGTADVHTVAGADLVVLADRCQAGDWEGDDGLILLKKISQLRRCPVVVCAAASQRELVERAIGELGFEPRRILGSAPEALAAALRTLMAIETDTSSRDSALTVLGIPPSEVVVPWDQATIGGIAAAHLLGDTARRRLAARLPALWPPGTRALAAAAVKIITGLVVGSRQLVSCFTAADATPRLASRVIALPVRLGSNGVTETVLPHLDPQDRIRLENTNER